MCMHNMDNHQETGRKTNWLPWLLVVGMGIILFLNSTGSLRAAKLAGYLPYAMFLLCPIMMLFHGFGHNHNKMSSNSCHGQEPSQTD
ncbi:MAG: DUF2933 domain-containing protein [Candidatus Saccharibacteria bacterium]